MRHQMKSVTSLEAPRLHLTTEAHRRQPAEGCPQGERSETKAASNVSVGSSDYSTATFTTTLSTCSGLSHSTHGACASCGHRMAK